MFMNRLFFKGKHFPQGDNCNILDLSIHLDSTIVIQF